MVSVTFENPEYLWFLLSIPVLVVAHFFMLRHAKRKAMKFANFVVLKRITGQRIITKNYTILSIRVLIILCAVFAVAQMIVWYEGVTNEHEYVIAIDTSASMTAADVIPTRIDAAKQAGSDFISALEPATRVGLVTFSGITFIEQPLTLDRKALIDAITHVEVVAAGTDIPGAVITSVNVLSNAQKAKAIILITDGSNTVEDFKSQSVRRAADYALLNHVKIYTIGVGSEVRSPIGYLPSIYNVTSVYNQDNLFFFANHTGGKYYPAADNATLALAYTDIKSGDSTGLVSYSFTSMLILACLLLILIEWGLLNTRFRSLP